MIEILNKVSGLQGKEEEKFSVVKVILGSHPNVLGLDHYDSAFVTFVRTLA